MGWIAEVGHQANGYGWIVKPGADRQIFVSAVSRRGVLPSDIRQVVVPDVNRRAVVPALTAPTFVKHLLSGAGGACDASAAHPQATPVASIPKRCCRCDGVESA